MKLRELAHSLFVCNGILKIAALLLPSKARAEWLEEWRSELWHVWHICHQNHGLVAPHRRKEIIAFTLGAFKDALWLRKNYSGTPSWHGFRPGTPARCILTLIATAAASLLIAYCRPSVWNVVRPNSYRDARDLVMISRSGLERASYPTVQFSDYQAWARNSGHLFTGLAFYQLAAERLANGTKSTAITIARGSSNLFELLGAPISFEVSTPAAPGRSRLFLSRSAWVKYFHADPHVFGRTLWMDGQQAMVAGVIDDQDWRLPGHIAVWLLEDNRRLAGLPAGAAGYVLAHAAPAKFPIPPDGRRQMYVRRKYNDYDWFVCESLADRIREPFSIFSFALLLACLALPATTSLPLGEYPANSNDMPWSRRVRRWALLSLKFLLIVPIVYLGALDLAYASGAIPRSTSEFLQLLCSFWALLFAFRWALRDQRKRCPVCLRILTNPARVGQFSRNFLAWNGTELVCLSGHGLLHVPDIPTSWFSCQRWLSLDPSWSALFPLGT